MEGCKGLSAEAITSFSSLRIPALPVACQSPSRVGRKQGRSLASTEYSKRSSPPTQRPKVCGGPATNGQDGEPLAGHFLSLHILSWLLRGTLGYASF